MGSQSPQNRRVPHPFRSIIAERVGDHEPQPAWFLSATLAAQGEIFAE
jgi:hypothetical protein